MCHNGVSASRIFGLNNKDVLEKLSKMILVPLSVYYLTFFLKDLHV